MHALFTPNHPTCSLHHNPIRCSCAEELASWILHSQARHWGDSCSSVPNSRFPSPTEESETTQMLFDVSILSIMHAHNKEPPLPCMTRSDTARLHNKKNIKQQKIEGQIEHQHNNKKKKGDRKHLRCIRVVRNGFVDLLLCGGQGWWNFVHRFVFL